MVDFRGRKYAAAQARGCRFICLGETTYGENTGLTSKLFRILDLSHVTDLDLDGQIIQDDGC